MAGSYRHATTDASRFRNNETFCDLVENLGDAYETAEEMYGMIWYLAWLIAMARIMDPYTGDGPEPNRAQVLEVVREAEEHYADGLRIGGRQRER